MSTDIHDLAAGYALNALETEERDAFELHLASCDECQREVESYEETAAILASAVTADPPASLKASLLDEIENTEQLPATSTAKVIDLRSRMQSGRLLIAAAVAAIVFLGGVFASTQLLDTGQSEFASILEQSDAQEAVLTGEGGASFVVAWSPSTGEFALRGEDVPELAADETYEFWFIGDGDPVNAGLFLEDEGAVDLTGQLPGTPAVWAITVEPSGGSPAPTGEIIYSVAL